MSSYMVLMAVVQTLVAAVLLGGWKFSDSNFMILWFVSIVTGSAVPMSAGALLGPQGDQGFAFGSLDLKISIFRVLSMGLVDGVIVTEP